MPQNVGHEVSKHNYKIFIIFLPMKKALLTILSLTVFSLALDCINLATYGTIYTLPNARPDSTFSSTMRHSIYANGDTIDEPYYYTTKTIWNGNAIEQKVNYEGSKLDSLEVKSTSTPAITVQQDDDEIFYKISSDGSKTEERTYIKKDSSYTSTSKRGYEAGESYTSTNTEERFIRDDTLFIHKSYSTSSSTSFSLRINHYLIIHDPDNKNQCIEKNYSINDDGTKSVKDEIQRIFTIEETANGFMITTKTPNSSTPTKSFYVYNENTTSIKRKIRQAIIPEKAKHFDLLGRPAQGKYTMDFLK